jgi:hypothetical protein
MRLLIEEPARTFAEASAALGVPKGSIGPTHGRSLARLRRDPHLAGVVGAETVSLPAGRRARVVGHDLG